MYDKYQSFLSQNFQYLKGKFSIYVYLNRRVFVRYPASYLELLYLFWFWFFTLYGLHLGLIRPVRDGPSLLVVDKNLEEHTGYHSGFQSRRHHAGVPGHSQSSFLSVKQ